MTLEEFRLDTAGMPGHTEIKVLDPWGDQESAAFVTVEDLYPGDPLIDELDPSSILITGEAD